MYPIKALYTPKDNAGEIQWVIIIGFDYSLREVECIFITEKRELAIDTISCFSNCQIQKVS